MPTVDNSAHAPSIMDAQGRRRTLARGAEAFIRLHTGQGWLICGLGPYIDAALHIPPGDNDVLWMECPALHNLWDAHTPGWRNSIPARWREIHPDDAPAQALGRTVLLYRQGPLIDPDFWGHLLGRIQAGLCGAAQAAHNTTLVCLPGSEQDLLHQELAQAFAETGCSVRSIAAHDAFVQVRQLLRETIPALYFSVNLRGLDPAGETFHLLRACAVRVALWFVDNPWHILSALRLPWWKAAHIFVTDASFIPALHAAGAGQVYHLPLACAQHMFTPPPAPPPASPPAPAPTFAPTTARVLFVGRSAFPDKARFFAAAKIPDAIEQQARALLAHDQRPDFHWWAQKLASTLWPGNAVRNAGLGAERCAALLRVRWLTAALPCGLAVYGDAENWRQHMPDAPQEVFHTPVDYYKALPILYAAAPYTLNVTSLLLPAGLTQRHFDVWAAGGFVLTDTTAGLHIFPPDIVRETALSGAAQVPLAIARLENAPALRSDIQQAWRAHMRAEHLYIHRAARIWECVLCKAKK